MRKIFISSNLATSVDGKIATASRVHFPLGTKLDRETMQVIRKKHDAILMGAATLRASRKSLRVPGAARQPMNVILSAGLAGVDPRWPFFRDRSITRVLFVTSNLAPGVRKDFEKTSKVIHIRPTKKEPIASLIAKELAALGVRRLLVEGGGEVMWDFASLDLIDEYYVTLTPRIVGGAHAPTLVDGAGFEPGKVLGLRLKKLRRVGNELYLVYARTGRRL